MPKSDGGEAARANWTTRAVDLATAEESGSRPRPRRPRHGGSGKDPDRVDSKLASSSGRTVADHKLWDDPRSPIDPVPYRLPRTMLPKLLILATTPIIIFASLFSSSVRWA